MRVSKVLITRSLTVIFAAVLFAGCGKSDKESFSEAEKLLKDSKVKEALAAFEQFAKDFPKSEMAATALFNAAQIYQGMASQSTDPLKEFDKAIATYQKVYELYPEDKDAEQAMFMVAYIIANEKKEYETATSLFKNFLSKYPKSDLKQAAQDELDNMGLSAEEILKKKTDGK